MASLTSDELEALRCPSQRVRLYLAVWSTFRIETYTELLVDTDADPPTPIPAETVDESDFVPVLNIGPHRLAFVGEAIAFDASASFERGGASISGGTWSFPGGSSTSESGVVDAGVVAGVDAGRAVDFVAADGVVGGGEDHGLDAPPPARLEDVVGADQVADQKSMRAASRHGSIRTADLVRSPRAALRRGIELLVLRPVAGQDRLTRVSRRLI
ncbi:MAG TPA: hypothetical protein VH482_13360 [Thermomicrobiales bacterium]|jgi:hypothetical protein